MKVILLADVAGLGQKGEEKIVKPGYFRNYLLPNGLVILADSPEAKSIIEKIKKQKEEAEVEIKNAEKAVNDYQGTILNFTQKADDKGKLFGSIKLSDIKKELEDKISAKIKSISEKTAIKKIGDYEINAELANGGKFKFKVVVKAE